MKRLLSTALAVALLLGLGALAVLAHGGGDILTPADKVVAAAPQPQTAAAPDAPMASIYNDVALPLNVQSQFTSLGLTFDYAGLANFVSGAQQVLEWDTTLTPPRFRVYNKSLGRTREPFPQDWRFILCVDRRHDQRSHVPGG